MPTGGSRKLFEIVTIDGDDLVPVIREEHDAGVDHVIKAGSGEELTCGSAERFVQSPDLDARERLGEAGLPRATPPHLRENACVGEWEVARRLCRL